MTFRRAVVLGSLLWIAAISSLHLWVNQRSDLRRWLTPASERGPQFRIGFLPVTCHLTCPVTHFINENITGEQMFTPLRFNGWPELKEAFLAGHTEATFILALMAIRLREEGVPLKIVYLGHRTARAHGSKGIGHLPHRGPAEDRRGAEPLLEPASAHLQGETATSPSIR